MLNKTMIRGYLGNDAKVEQVNGKSCVNFSVACTQKWKSPEGVEVKRTTWFSCTYWEREKVAEFLKKGTHVLIEGEISAGVYVNHEKNAIADLRLRVRDLELLPSGAPKAENKPDQENTETAHPAVPVQNDEQLPF